jgi:ubiquinone/menaquinone biosynthesis C-methylase UbiE
MEYSGELSRIQQSLADCTDQVARRAAVLGELEPQNGERILDLGCGGGFYAREISAVVGPKGKVFGIDLSDDQIAAATERCKGLGNVSLETGDAFALPYDTASFDAVLSVQVLEYLKTVEGALNEVIRVLKPGGRFANVSTNWSQVYWTGEGANPGSTIMTAWTQHAAHPNLAASLRSRLNDCGFGGIEQVPLPMLNTSFNEDRFSYWLAKLVALYVESQGVSERQTTAWLDELRSLDEANEYLFGNFSVITKASKM